MVVGSVAVHTVRGGVVTIAAGEEYGLSFPFEMSSSAHLLAP